MYCSEPVCIYHIINCRNFEDEYMLRVSILIDFAG